jgi:phenylacetate-CoA ligase
LLEKAVIRANFERLRSADLASRKWFHNTSGGSTGEPVRLIQDAAYQEWGTAVKLLCDSWAGYSTGQAKVVLWGSERDLFTGREPANVVLARKLRNEVWLNTFRMDPARIRRYIAIINQQRPVQILTYVDSIYEVARLIEREGIAVHSPRSIMTSAGTLYPEMRTVIERAFAAPVFNRYGSREVGDIACECEEHQGLHLLSPTHYVELIRADGELAGPGEICVVVLTWLTNYAMPLFLYRIGDLASWAAEPCPCGRGMPLLATVSGRTNSLIRTRSQTFDSAAISTLFYFKDSARTEAFSSFSKFRFIQNTEALMEVLIVVVDSESWTGEREILQQKLLRAFGPEVEIVIREVEEIAPSASGKYAYIVSELGMV